MEKNRLEAFSDGVIAIIITIILQQGPESMLAAAIGSDWKGKLSPLLYCAAIPLAFVRPWIAVSLYVLVALIWLIPDPRIERTLRNQTRPPAGGR